MLLHIRRNKVIPRRAIRSRTKVRTEAGLNEAVTPVRLEATYQTSAINPAIVVLPAYAITYVYRQTYGA